MLESSINGIFSIATFYYRRVRRVGHSDIVDVKDLACLILISPRQGTSTGI